MMVQEIIARTKQKDAAHGLWCITDQQMNRRLLSYWKGTGLSLMRHAVVFPHRQQYIIL